MSNRPASVRPDVNRKVKVSAQKSFTTGADFDSLEVSYYPQGEIYATPLPSVFIERCKSLRQLPKAPEVLLRDGFASLADFQKRFRPGTLEQTLLIHHDLRTYVTSAWRSNVRFFRLGAPPAELAYFESERPDGIIFTGVGLAENFRSPAVREAVVHCLSKLSNKIIRVYALTPTPPGRNSEGRRRNLGTTRWLTELTGRFPNFVDWTQCAEIPSMDRLWLVELDSRRWIADPYLTHLVMARGARLAQTRRPAEGERFVPLSLRHGLWIGPAL